MRSLADQTTDQLGGTWSVLVRQKRDHVRLEALLTDLAAARGVEQERVLHRISRLVFPHAFAEEAVLWPQVRRLLPDGEALTLRVEREHQEVNELWSRLEADGLPPAEREHVLARLADVLREDVRDEEDELLPRLQERLERRRLRALGVAWEVVRRTAPTRPHPVVSRRPPGNALAALPLSVLDRTRDGVDTIARRSSRRRAVRLQTWSELLGAAARRAEHWRFLRAGERPSTRRTDPADVRPPDGLRFEVVRDLDGSLGAPIEDVAQEALDAIATLYRSDSTIDVEEQLRVQLRARGIAAADDHTLGELARGVRSGHPAALGRPDGSVRAQEP